MQLIQNGWIFSSRWDTSIFAIPLLIGISLGIADVQVSRSAGQFLIFGFLIHTLADAGHVLITGLPVIGDRTIARGLAWRLWLVPTLSILVAVAIFSWSSVAFYRTLAFFASFHIIMQQYGFLQISRANFRGVKTYLAEKLELILFFNLFLFPMYFWLTGNSKIALSWFASNDFGEPWTSVYFEVIHVLHLCLVIGYFGWQIYPLFKGQPINLGRLLLTGTSWLWYYLGLVQSSNPSVFWVTLMLTHGIGYILFVKTYWRLFPNRDYAPPEWFRKDTLLTIGLYVTAIGILGQIWYMLAQNTSFGILVPVLWSPLIMHYIFDGIVWKAKFYQGSG
jgi:hypothetical protein